MVRLATVNDYPAVSDLLNTHPSFTSKPKEFMTMFLAATSKVSIVSAIKIAVVVDSYHKRIVGCVILNTSTYFLRASTVCIAEKKNWQLMITHIIDFLKQYAETNGYSGFSITLTDKTYSNFVKTLNPSFNFIDYHRGILDLKDIAQDSIQPLSSLNIAEFNIQNKHVSDFSDRELKLPICLATQDYNALLSTLEMRHNIPARFIDGCHSNFYRLLQVIEDNVSTSKYLAESMFVKLVISDKGHAVGYALFRTTERHSHSIEIADIFVLPQYAQSDIPRRLLLAVGRYGARNGAKFMCGRGVDSSHRDYIRQFYESADMIPDEFTSVFVFNNIQDIAEKELAAPDTDKTSVFSG